VDDQAAVAALDSGPVDVTVITATRKGVLAVPVTALLALGEGGYALQVVTDRGTSLVGVRTGMFAGALVEVTGDGLAEGMRVVRAS
jgi:multidrug efflux pump subunit AcrA (membrane-fusion protein)